MSLSPLRAAFWALSTSIGISIALLAIGSFSPARQVPPTASLTSIDNAGISAVTHDALQPAEHQPSEPISSDRTDGVTTDSRASDELPSHSAPVDVPGSLSIPVNVVSHPDGSALAIGLEEALHPSVGTGEFFELPPPPEFDDSAVETHDPTQLDFKFDELIGRVQTNFDGLHNDFDSLHTQFVGLQDQLSNELAAVKSAHGDMQRTLSEFIASTTSQEPVPFPFELDVILLLMPLRGEARHGALTLISRNSREFDLAMTPEIADRTSGATCQSNAATLSAWLQHHGQAQFQQHSGLHLDQQTVGEIDLSHSIASGMIQARGSQIRERVITLPWDGPLAIRAAATPSGLLEVEVSVGSTRLAVPGCDWTSATLAPGSTLILTAALDELYRSIDEVSSHHRISPTQQAEPRRPASSELIVLLQQRVLTNEVATPHVNADGPLPFQPDEATTR